MLPQRSCLWPCVGMCLHMAGRGTASSYLGWSDLIAVVHRHQVIFAHGIGHVQGNAGHEGGTVEQVSVEAVVFCQSLLVVGATGPLPLSPHSLQWDARWEGIMPAGMHSGGRDTPGPSPLGGSPVRRRAARSSSTLARSSRRTRFRSCSCWVRENLGGGSPMSILSLGSGEGRCVGGRGIKSW